MSSPSPATLQVDLQDALPAGQAVAKSPEPAPGLVRSSSYEPPRIGLASLPPPVFSRGPSGQRSVPAVDTAENININNIKTKMVGLSGVSNSDSTSNSVNLGNGAMNAEPWNLWTDSSAPGPSKDSETIKSQSRNSHDDQLASAVSAIAGMVLDAENQLNRPVSSKTSPTFATTTPLWPEEFQTASSLPATRFALDPSSSPPRIKTTSSKDLTVWTKRLSLADITTSS